MAVAGAIGHSCVGRAGPEWVVPAIFWALLVGDPGTNKSPAVKRVTKVLLKIEAEMGLPYRSDDRDGEAGQAHGDLLEAAERIGGTIPGLKQPMPGRPPQLVCQKLNLVGIEETIADNPRGFLIVLDEIVNFVRTPPNKGRDLILSSIDADRYQRRVGYKRVDLPRAGLWVVGGIQPDVLSPLLPDLAADGFSARFMPIVGHRFLLDEISEPVDDGSFEDILRRLLVLPMEEGARSVPREIPFSRAAQVMLFERNKAQRANPCRESGPMKAVIDKSVGTISRLALILGVLRAVAAGQDPEEITVDDLTHAMTLFDSYLLPMSRAAYGRPLSALEKAGHDVIGKLRMRGAPEIPLRDLKRMVAGDFRTKAGRNDVVAWVASQGVLRWLGAEPSGPRGGAPSPRLAVHPQIWQDTSDPEA